MEITLLIAAVLFVGFYMAWNIGANDVANAMGTSVGSKALTLRRAILVAAVFEFLGAFFFGKHVAETIRKGIVDPIQLEASLPDPSFIAYGALAALIGASLWLNFASYMKWPVSTTHSIVGGMIGFGIAAGGLAIVNWPKMGQIAMSWVVSPVAGAFVAFIVFSLFRLLVIKKYPDRNRLERIFLYFQIMTACFVAFAHGSNDVANAIGPIATALTYAGGASEFATKVGVPTWLLAFGGVGIIVGLATWGYRVMGTIGEKVTALTPTRGFCAEFSTASVVVANSQLGLPISTTHVLVGSVIGVGLARGLKALNLRIIKDIFFSWIATVPIVAVISGITYKILIMVV